MELGLEAFSRHLTRKSNEAKERPSEWIGKHFYVPEPRNPLTGEILPPGPIRLADHQKRIIDEMLSRKEDGMLKYSTAMYSAPKKSGKSAISSAITLYFAYHNSNSFCYVLANDGKQSEDRLYAPIRTCIRLHNQMGGIFKDVRASMGEVTLPNHTKIEAVPCDAAGEAGAEPIFTAWSEIWAFETPLKRRLWTEMTIPPTKWGRALRLVESYAGFQGTSELLWNLYESIVKEEYRHPDFPDFPVYASNGFFCYWDHYARMIWQTPEYYAEEARRHPPAEFLRVHKNEWVSPVGAFIQPEHWKACEDTTIPELVDPSVPCVIGIDAGVENDMSALVLVTRHPIFPDTDAAIRLCKIFVPGQGQSILLPIATTIRDWCKRFNVVQICYDMYQLESMVAQFRQGIISVPEEEIRGMLEDEIKEYLRIERRAVERWYYRFNQQGARSIADKKLYDGILHTNLKYNPNLENGIAAKEGQESLTKHVLQSGVSLTKGQYRLQKLSQKGKIDACVALSMSYDRCMALGITNKELDDNYLVQSLMREKLTYAQFQTLQRNKHTKIT